jgi:hypothetical protein
LNRAKYAQEVFCFHWASTVQSFTWFSTVLSLVPPFTIVFHESDEVAYMTWEQFFILLITEGINKGLIRVQALIDIDKTMELYLQCTAVRDQHAQVCDVIEDPNNPNCFARSLWQLRQWSPSEQECMFCPEPDPKLMAAYKAAGLPYHTTLNHHIGKHKLAGSVREIHEHTDCVAPLHSKVSNHGGRSYNIQCISDNCVNAA